MISTLLSLLSEPPVDMADALRSEGKIYVVVVSILLLFLGVSLYVYFVDVKLRRLVKKIGELSSEKKEEDRASP